MDKIVQVGVPRYSGQNSDGMTDERIHCASKTAYALLGAGVHGSNRIGAKVSHQVIVTCVLFYMV